MTVANASAAGSNSLLAYAAMTENPSNMTGPTPATAKRRVLVVEDEMLIGMLLEDMLTDLGHEVVAIVPRLKDALAAVDRETYDGAVLDVHLHGESAFPVAEALIAEGHSVRVRHRLRRTRPAGSLSRPAGSAEAVRQGRPGAGAQDTLSLIRLDPSSLSIRFETRVAKAARSLSPLGEGASVSRFACLTRPRFRAVDLSPRESKGR